MSFFKMSRLTTRSLLHKPVTTRYPASPRQPVKDSRGQLAFDDKACVYCTACQKKCPTGAIVVERAQKTLEIDPLRCISCGYCVEICPKDSLALTTSHGVPAVDRKQKSETKFSPNKKASS